MTDLDRALLDPAAVFSTPEAVLDREDLDREQKIEVLRRWDYDEAEKEVAEEEGMEGDGRPSLTQRISAALQQLSDDAADATGSPPTKQRGL